MEDHEKYVTLSLDGTTWTKGLSYNKKLDSIIGYVDCAEFGQSTTIADQGVVLMIRGLTSHWKQVIGFVICCHGLSASTLRDLISSAITAVNQTGLIVKAIIMDQESTHTKWMSDSSVNPDRPYITHNQSNIYMMPDPPHLIKNLRNNFMDKSIVYTLNGKQGVAKWEHLQALYALDSLS